MKKIVNNNLARFLVWILSLAAITVAILNAIEKNYNRYIVNQDSCNEYRVGIFCIAFVTGVLSLLWWGIAVSKWKVKERMENRTQKWGIGFISVCFIAAIIFFIIFPGVKLNSGTLKPVIYMFSYPCIFGMNLFLASPNNVYKVIFPYSKMKNLLFSAVFGLIGIMIVYKGGI